MADEVIEPNIDDISPEALEKVGDVITRIEMSKQQTALAQIKATSEDNERQYQYALKQADLANKRWHKSFNIAAVAVGVLGVTSIYLLVVGKTDIGLGLLATTITGVFGYLAGVGASK